MSQTFEYELANEVREIVGQQAFKRAPMQARLLQYLCDRSIDCDSRQITQYDIAVEALGRPASFDETSNSYVRVQICRLRKSLAAYYSICAPSGSGHVYIKKGQYGLSLGSLHIAYPELFALRNDASHAQASETNGASYQEAEPEIVEPTAGPKKRPGIVSRNTAILIGIIGIMALGISFIFGRGSPTNADAQFVGLDKPTISLSFEITDPARELPSSGALSNAIEVEANQRLARSLILRDANSSTEADYLMSITLDAEGTDKYRTEISLKRSDGEQIRLREQLIDKTIAGAREQIGWELSSMFSPPGLIARDLANQISEQPQNDFECFLQVELGRTEPLALNQRLELCASQYPDSTYYPYLRARELFLEIQGDIKRTGSFAVNLEVESELGELLREFPENPYLNTLAAKILFSRGNCDEGARHAEIAFQMGRDYPALELAILVDKSSCVRDAGSWVELADRIDLIVNSQPDPHALLEAYAIAGMIMVGRPEGVAQIPERPFAFPRDMPIIELTDAMRAYARGEMQEVPPELATMVWNLESRRKIADLGRHRKLP